MRLENMFGWLVLAALAAPPAFAAPPSIPDGSFGLDPIEPRPASSVVHTGQNGDLSLEQVRMAEGAWRYFENNFQPDTCLYNSVDGYPSTTMWDTASAIAALVSAYELELVHEIPFNQKMRCLLETLGRLPLYQDALPNKAYNTITLEEVDYANNPGELGVSAIDLGRLLIWLDIVKDRYPKHADLVDRFVLRWDFCDLVDRSGTLYGALHSEQGPVWLQEGRLGYEEYAAAGFQLWGFETPGASAMEPYEELSIYGVRIAYDGRDPAKYGAHNYVVTEAYLLLGLELNWDHVGDTNPSQRYHSDKTAQTLAKRVYRAQHRRWKRTGTLTARTEHHVDGAPYFVYDTVYTDGVAWNTIAEDGTQHPELAAVSTKAALGMDVLFDTNYTKRLAEFVSPLLDPEKGLYEGIYELSGERVDALTANTNGIVLESLLYKKLGKLVTDQGEPSLWDQVPTGEIAGNDQCLPAEPAFAKTW